MTNSSRRREVEKAEVAGPALLPMRVVAPSTWGATSGPRWVIHADHVVERPDAFAQAVADGLDRPRRVLPYRYLYDAAGSDIYEKITEQPEYYPTRVEESILAEHSDAIRELAGATTLVEFGSGSSRKTRQLLAAWCRRGPARYMPIDISPSALAGACESLTNEFPSLTVEGLATTYDRAMPLLPAASPATFVFLGSSIGNFEEAELARFFEQLSYHMAPGDAFLLGIDLVKEPAMLEAAYNDAAGWSAAFTINLFERMNRELDAGIPIEALEHVAYWNQHLEQIEIYGRFDREVEIRLDTLDRGFRIAPGEMLRTEISRKFRPDAMAATAAAYGLRGEGRFTDPDKRFAVLLLRRHSDNRVAASRRDEVKELLASVRRRTEAIVDGLTDAEVAAAPSDLVGPIAWDLGHIADFERLWLVDEVGERRSGGGLDATFDPAVNPRHVRGEMTLPTRTECLAKLAGVRARATGVLQEGGLDPSLPLTAGGYVYRMVAQHEAQHQETMLQGLQQRSAPDLYDSFERRPEADPDVLDPSMVLVPAGGCTVGTDDRTIAYDNERPRHRLWLDAFEIDRAPVTNAAFLEFIRAGGYRNPEWWDPRGWEIVEREGWAAPAYWRETDAGWVRQVFGRAAAVEPLEPVIHVSWYEAAAFARWAGKRLPTEQEWEKAAAWDPLHGEARRYPWGDEPPSRLHANLDQHQPEPGCAGAYPAGRSFYGCEQLLGDVFEWTASAFEPYPGFEAFPYAEYSEVFFGDEYRVLRGASWATPRFMARNTYRNWDLPQRRHIFAGFRCARDA